jgi:hypothetical protein
MNLKFCSREKEVAAALRDRGWPDICDAALRAHVESCRHCSDLVLVATTLQQARSEAAEASHLPAPGILWWRAQLRRRNGAVERIARPIALIEKLALAAMALGILCLAAWQWNQISDGALWLASLARPSASLLDTLWTPFSGAGGWMPVLLIASLVTLALFGGLAVYLLLEKE